MSGPPNSTWFPYIDKVMLALPPQTMKTPTKIHLVLSQIPNFSLYGKKMKGDLKTLIASIYHLRKEDKYKYFNAKLQQLLEQVPNSAEIFIGQDTKVNTGISRDREELVRCARTIWV